MGRIHTRIGDEDITLSMDKYELLSRTIKDSIETHSSNDRRGKGKVIGDLVVFEDKIVGQGSNGTLFYLGTLEGYRVAAVKCVKSAQFDLVKEGIRNHYRVGPHMGVNRLYGIVEKDNTVYVAWQLCDDDLHHYVHDDWAYAGFLRLNGHPTPDLLTFMRSIVSAVAKMHDLRIIHGDLNPSHVLILGGCSKLSGMDGSRRLAENESSLPMSPNAGTLGWQAPEQVLHLAQSLASDVYTLGCLLFFILSRGKHPFGDDPLEREDNMISNYKVDLSLVKDIPEATDFFSRVLNFNPELRPKASEVLLHPMLWTSRMRMFFLWEAYGRAESGDDKSRSIVEELNSKGDTVFVGSWNGLDGSADSAFINQCEDGLCMSLSYDKLEDLLCLVQDTVLTCGGLPLEPMPDRMESLDCYFCRRFPNLFNVVYDVMHKHCQEEEWFRKSLKDTRC